MTATLEALIYSNLFKVKYSKKARRDNRIKQPTLAEMQLNPRKHVNPFISTMQRGKRFFGVPKYFFRLTFTSAIIGVPMCCVQWVHFVEEEEKQTHNCSIGTIDLNQWETWNPFPRLPAFIAFSDIQPSRWGHYPSFLNQYQIDIAEKCKLLLSH